MVASYYVHAFPDSMIATYTAILFPAIMLISNMPITKNLKPEWHIFIFSCIYKHNSCLSIIASIGMEVLELKSDQIHKS